MDSSFGENENAFDAIAAELQDTYAAPKVLDAAQRYDDEMKDERKEFGYTAENNRQRVFIFLDEADSSAAAAILSFVIIALILLSSVAFMIETIPQFKSGGCVDLCEEQATEANCENKLGDLCEWVADDKGTHSIADDERVCRSYAGKAAMFGWNDVGGFSVVHRPDLFGGDANFHQCSETSFTGDLDLEDAAGTQELQETDVRICTAMTDNAVVRQKVMHTEAGVIVDIEVEHIGKMKDVCEFQENSNMVFLHWFETMCIVIFTIEYVLRMATCTQRPRTNRSFTSYFFQPFNIIDLLSVAPFYVELVLGNRTSLSVLRMLRMSRIFRVLKAGSFMNEIQLFMEGYKRSRDGLMLLLSMLLFYLCIFGSVLYLVEYPAQTEDCYDGCGHLECYAVHDNGVWGPTVSLDLPIDCDGLSNKRAGPELSKDDAVADSNGVAMIDTSTGEFLQPSWKEDERGFMNYDGDLMHLESTCRLCCASCETRGFTSILTTWYFILATMTTVGYGDHYPGTVLGKFVCSTCMCAGILVLALPIIVIGNAFEEVFAQEEKYKRERKAKTERKKMERLDQNSEEVKQLKAKQLREATPALDSDVACSLLTSMLESLMEECGEADEELATQLEAARDALNLS
jgi:hypothetical protein